MDILLFIVGISGFVASLLFLLVYSIQKEPKKKPLMLMGISIVLFTLSLFMNSSDIDTEADKESVEEEKEVETSNNDNEDNKKDNKKDNDEEPEKSTYIDDIQGKDEGTVKIQTDTNVEEEVDLEEEKEEQVKEQETENKDKYKEAIISNIGSDDTLESVELKEDDIIIKVTLGDPPSLFTYKDLAISRYSSITDELLEQGNSLEDITVVFRDVGTITMNTSEKVKNEYGQSYFEQITIEERLNK